MRHLAALAVLALTASACGGGPAPRTQPAAAPLAAGKATEPPGPKLSVVWMATQPLTESGGRKIAPGIDRQFSLLVPPDC